jgi:hypothetical protein
MKKMVSTAFIDALNNIFKELPLIHKELLEIKQNGFSMNTVSNPYLDREITRIVDVLDTGMHNFKGLIQGLGERMEFKNLIFKSLIDCKIEHKE